MTTKKERKPRGKSNNSKKTGPLEEIKTSDDLTCYLKNIRDRFGDSAPPILAQSAMASLFNMDSIYKLLNTENREIAREIWQHLKHAGSQVHNPRLLYTEEEIQANP